MPPAGNVAGLEGALRTRATGRRLPSAASSLFSLTGKAFLFFGNM
jgi:hypothetical protein